MVANALAARGWESESGVATMETMEPRWLLSDSPVGPPLLDAANDSIIVMADADDVVRFGDVDGKKNVKAVVTDVNGVQVTFALSGGGYGEIVGGAYFSMITLSNTTTSSVLSITPKDATIGTSIGSIVSAGPLKSVDAKNVDIRGGAQFDGGVLNVTLRNVYGAEQRMVVGAFPKANEKVSFKFDRIYNLSIASEMPIKSITATEWRDTGGAYDTVTAPSLETLKITGDNKRFISGNFEASLILGNVLQPARFNDSGTVVGSSLGIHLGPQAFVLRGGQLIKLGTLGGLNSMAIGVNSAGLVVGMAETGAFSNGRAVGHAFLWDGTTMHDLGTLGGANSTAFDINDAGWVVGVSELDAEDDRGNPISHAFLWRDGVMIDLGALGGTNSEATAINNNGVIVGRTQTLVVDGAAYAYPSRAFLWSDGSMVLLPTLGGSQAWAMDVNNHNAAVGWANTGESVHGVDTSHAVMWVNGQAVDLGTLGGQQSAAFGVNDHGQVVGWSETGRVDYMGQPILHAFLWENGVMTDLGVEMVGDAQAQAYISIDNHGVIVGYTPEGSFRIENGRVLPLSPDNPSTVSLKSASVAGSVGYCLWQFAGSADSITIGGMADTWWFYAAGNVKNLKIGWGNRSTVAIGGTVGTFQTAQWTNGLFKAAEAGTIKTTGDKKLGLAGDCTGGIVVAGRIKTLSVAGSSAGLWDAGAINSAEVRGHMTNMEIRLHEVNAKQQTLGKLDVKGLVTNTNVTVAGSVGTFSVTEWSGQFAAAEVGTFKTTGDKKLGVVGDCTGDIVVAGRIKTLSVAGSASGLWDVGAINSAEVRGDMSNMLVLLRQVDAKLQTLGKLEVRGALTEATVVSAGTVGNVRVNGLVSRWLFTAGGDVKEIKLGGADLSNVTVNGTINTFQTGQWTHGRITATEVGTFKTAGDKKLGLAGDFNGELVVAGRVKNLSVAGSATGLWDAGAITSAEVRGDMTAMQILLSQKDAKLQTLGKLDVKGLISGVIVQSAGSVGTFSVTQWTSGQFVADEVGTFKTTGEKKLGIAGDCTSDLVVAGRVKTLSIAGSASGVWDMGAITSAEVRGNMTNMEIRLHEVGDEKTQTLGKLDVKGMMFDTAVLSAGSIGTVSAVGARNVDVVAGTDLRADIAGLDFDGLAALLASAAFNANTMIKSVKVSAVKGLTVSAENINILAGDVGTVTLDGVQFNQGGNRFGVIAKQIARVTATGGDVKFSWPNQTGTNQEGDFVVRVV
ncbi:MAG: hypothetical protein FWE88_05105 [Phycisphaerae bacterium]|nr:hypothetical protein [Phycisphaerae bacterium]